MNNVVYVLDASAFINGYEPGNNVNYTVSDITHEVKDLKSQIRLNQAIDEGNLIVRNPNDKFKLELDEIIKKSGDSLRLSEPDKNLIALALDIQNAVINCYGSSQDSHATDDLDNAGDGYIFTPCKKASYHQQHQNKHDLPCHF